MPVRLKADEFVQKIREAPEWQLYRDSEDILTLAITAENGVEIFHEPDPLGMDDFAYRMFLNQLWVIAEGKPDVRLPDQ